MSNSVLDHFSRQNLGASREWIEACVQWCRSQASITNSKQVVKACHDQWLATDIRDPGVQIPSSIPIGVIKSEIKYNLASGIYPVQVLSAYDIGQPAFMQLQKINRIKDENSSVSADDDTNKRYMAAWEPKAKRMLKLILTTGSGESFSAIESEPIAKLVDPVCPGLKLKLIGPVTCRRGSLMLKAKNVIVLGGQVDDLKEKFSYKKQLQSLIGQDNDCDPLPTPTLHPTGKFVPKGIPVKFKSGKVKSEPLTNHFKPITVAQSRKPFSVKNEIKNEISTQDCDVFNDDEDDFFATIEIPQDQNQVEDVFNDDDDDFFSNIDLGTPSTSGARKKIRRTK